MTQSPESSETSQEALILTSWLGVVAGIMLGSESTKLLYELKILSGENYNVAYSFVVGILGIVGAVIAPELLKWIRGSNQ